jgi:hypothetical protein|tara:strand:+ start:662 stop:2125 length:1464 start_codon:yes stop_codon:yes gene_type:complete
MRQFLALVMALIFASCSGSSSQDAPTLSASSNQIFITKVIDGYISGANIFIDHNWNLVQDVNEPSAYEDTENNRYYFEESQFTGIESWSIECSRNRPRVAEIPIGAMDSERGEVTSEYKLYYFPYFGNSNGQQGLQGEYRANVTPLTSLFLGYVNNLLGDGSISAIDGCGSDGNLIAERVIAEVQDVLRQLNDRFEVNVYSFYDDFIASNDQELQTFGEQIVDFLKITNQVSFLLENEYDINLRTALDIALVETILKKENFDTVKFHLFSDSPQELLMDGFFTYDIYMFGDVVADSEGNLLDQNNNIYELTLDNLKLNSDFRIRNVIHSYDEIFDGIKVLFEKTESPMGTEWHIDFGTFSFEDNLVRISKNSSRRYIWNKIQFGLRLDFVNPINQYFDYDFERIFSTRDPGELKTIYDEIIAPSSSMEGVVNNRYLLYEGDHQAIRTQEWSYYEHQNMTLDLSCTNNLSNETVYGADAFELCSQHID